MRKILLTGMLFLSLGVKSQLANGSIAPDFTLTDINGNSHHLYGYLDQGYTVVIDVSATWCGPCWAYHNSGALENLWVDHGPTGGTGVSSSTTNNVIVLLIEGDGTTNSADLHGTGSSTQGNWVAGTSHPIIDPASPIIDNFNSAYAIAYFPTCYKICPNRIVEDVDQQTEAQIYSKVTACPPLPGPAIDVAAQSYKGNLVSCPGSSYTPVVQIMNNSSTALTTATVTITQGGSTVSTGTYSGNLSMFGTANVTCSAISNFNGGNLSISVTTTGDSDATNNTLTTTISNASAIGISNSVVVKTSTDQYGSETTWAIKTISGVLKAHGGPYADMSVAGSYPQADVNGTLPNGCYYLEVNDGYGDGFDGSYGTGSVNVTVNGTSFVGVTNFTSAYAYVGFKIDNTAGIQPITELSDFLVFPNPASDKLNVTFEAKHSNYTVMITDLIGNKVFVNQYNNLSGTQFLELPLAGIATGNYFVTIASDTETHNKMIAVK